MRRQPSWNTRCRFGIAVRDVTPPIGVYARSWGAAMHDLADGVHRPCTATVAIFAPLDGDALTLVLVALDLGWFANPADETALRAALRERGGVGEDALLLSLSHAHSTANAASHLADRPGGAIAAAYRESLPERIGDAIAAARADLAPAWITWGYGRCALAQNRDYWDEQADRYVCGYNPTPPTPPDDALLVGRATADDGTVRATLFNYGCHPTTLAWDNHLLSPDYPGAAREILERAFHAPAVFLHGADGELGPKEGFVGDPTVADRNGRILGYAAASAIEALPPPGMTYAYQGIVPSGADIGVWRYETATADERAGDMLLGNAAMIGDVPLREYLPAATLRERMETTTDRPTWEKTQRQLMIREAIGEANVQHLTLWCWRLGDALLLAVPDEPYNVLQRQVRAAFPDRPVLILTVTNGTLGYLCPADTYGSGRYQVVQSPYQPGCLETVTAMAISGLHGIIAKT